MIDGLLVVTVVAGPRLLAINLHRETVDVDGGVADAAVAVAGAFDMPMDPVEQGAPHGLEIRLAVGQPIDEPGLSGLAGQALIEHFFAGPVPGGHLHGGIMGEPIEIILIGLSQGHGVNSFPQQFDALIADAVLLARIDQSIGKGFGESEPMIEVPQQNGTGV